MNKIAALQKVELGLLSEFIRVAKQENLTWFAMFGTLLGAVRHGGFIPWDEDIDVVMPRNDYDRLRLSGGWFKEPYFLQTPQNDPSAAPRFIRLRRSDTAMIKEFPNYYTCGGHMGIYIDIIPVDFVPDIVVAQRIQVSAHRLNQQMLASAAFDESRGLEDAPECREADCYKWGGVPGCYGLFAELYEKTCSRYSGGPYYAMPVLQGERGYRVYDREWFSEHVEMTFEGLTIRAPIGWKEALIASYPEGLHERARRYRWLEPVKSCIIDTSHSYKEYIRRYTDMLVGIEGKTVYIFGAGDSLRIWLERYEDDLEVVCAFDNSSAKWGSMAYGTPVKNPEELPGLINENTRLIIASIYHKEIGEQLEKMGIRDYYIFIDGWTYKRG